MNGRSAVRPGRVFITEYVTQFRQTGNLWHLVRAAILVVRQGRGAEMLWSAWCWLRYRPARVVSAAGADVIAGAQDAARFEAERGFVRTRSHLLAQFGDRFAVHLLPHDFAAVRAESIVETSAHLILGEYAEDSARLALLTADGCAINHHYNGVGGVRHIHCIHRPEDAETILVTTGDSKKLLERWRVAHDGLRYVECLQRSLAGYTAAERIGGTDYFGSDFSSRPNYIATLDGCKYFFPATAYKLYPTIFLALADRYLVSVNTEHGLAGNREALCIFDTLTRQFVHCQAWQSDTPHR